MTKPEDMQVAVLMGGLGTRLKGLTAKCPKSMVDVWGRPFFDYQLKLMAGWGFRKFLFLVGYLADAVEEYYGDGEKFGVSISYCYDGKELLGTGGAVRRAYPHLEDEFMLIYGDSFMDINYEEALCRFDQGKKNGRTCLMTVLKNGDRYDKSNAVVRDNELILYDKHHTTPDMDYIDYGVCIYKKELFSDYREGEPFDVADLQTRESRAGRMAAYVARKRFYEIGSPESLKEFEGYARERFLGSRPAVFLDRDGVLNEIVYNEETEQLDSPLKPEELVLFPETVPALKLMREKGYYLFVVTNQPAAAKGKTGLPDLYDVNAGFQEELSEQGASVDDIYMCPHYPKAGKYTRDHSLIEVCGCRKPEPGLLLKAKGKYNIDWDNSYMAGDSYTDVLAGRAAGVKTVFIGGYKCDVCKRLSYDGPDHICGDVLEFAKKLPARGGKENTIKRK